MAQYRYLRGSKDSYEAVEFDVTKDGGNTYITTCVINVCLLLAGVTAFPCGNGDDIKLTPEQRLEVLEYLQAERKKITEGEVVKTLDGWHKSGLHSWEEYCKPGELVTEDIVDEFANSLPRFVADMCRQERHTTASRTVTEFGEILTLHLHTTGKTVQDAPCGSTMAIALGTVRITRQEQKRALRGKLRPSEARLRNGGQGTMATDYKEKIKKLLALAESPNEHEAKAALLKARQLMAEHKLMEAEVKDVEKQVVKEVWTDITCSKRRNPWVVHLSAAIGGNYCCKGCRRHRPGEQTQQIGFIGFEDDLEVCVAIFKYAVDCILSEIERIKKENQCYYSSYVKRLCDSYGYGFVVGIEAAFEEQQQENEEGWGLVLVMPQEVLEAAERIGHAEFRSRAEKSISGDAYAQGYRHGKEFNPTKRLQEA